MSHNVLFPSFELNSAVYPQVIYRSCIVNYTVVSGLIKETHFVLKAADTVIQSPIANITVINCTL